VVTVQRLALTNGSLGAVWSCAWCAAELGAAGIVHRDDCAWLGEVRAAQREADAQLAEAEAARGPKLGLDRIILRSFADLLRNPPEGTPDAT
jgi:hypothetical protein